MSGHFFIHHILQDRAHAYFSTIGFQHLDLQTYERRPINQKRDCALAGPRKPTRFGRTHWLP